MAQQTLNNGESGSSFRGKLNSMFGELYGQSPTVTVDGTGGGLDETDINAGFALLTSGRTWVEKIRIVGDFAIDTAIDIPSFTHLEIDGRITQNAGGTESGMIRNSDLVGGNESIVISGGTLVGETTRAAYQSGIYMENVAGLLIDGVTITGMENHGVDMEDVTDFIVQNCFVDACGDDGITVHSASQGGVIFNNICQGGLSATGGSSGIEIECQGATAPSDITISNNICRNQTGVSANGIHIIVDSGSGTASIERIIVANNVCYGNGSTGITGQGRSATYPVKNITYTGNVSYNNTKVGLNLNYAHDIVVIGNQITENTEEGVNALRTLRSTFSNNSIKGNGIHGIRLQQDSQHNIVSGNSIFDNGQASTGYGIRMEDDAYSQIIHNQIGNTGGAATPQYGISLQSVAGHIDIHHNTFLDSRNIGGAAINLGSVGSNPIRISHNIATTSINYVTEASGTGDIVSATTSDVITHGLDFTPAASDIELTMTNNPTNSPGNIWVDTIGSTTFTVNCENDPGASGLTFAWAVNGKKA